MQAERRRGYGIVEKTYSVEATDEYTAAFQAGVRAMAVKDPARELGLDVSKAGIEWVEVTSILDPGGGDAIEENYDDHCIARRGMTSQEYMTLASAEQVIAAEARRIDSGGDTAP